MNYNNLLLGLKSLGYMLIFRISRSFHINHRFLKMVSMVEEAGE